ncbi:unnamed protein product [Phytomonas sp. EM1]|nr:unnamed protein product [Phytomonas sp. EM1]|eukprot:CCW62819.1 unnamed protein product [Phytomonas sp. isolate EM1]
MKHKRKFGDAQLSKSSQRNPYHMSQSKLHQLQVFHDKFQILRSAQGNQYAFRKFEVARTFTVLVFTMILIYVMHMSYGWVLGSLWMVCLWVFGFFQFSSIIVHWVWRSSEAVLYTDALRRADIMMEPITTKSTSSGENETLSFGSSCMQGWRRTMEDAHTLILLEEGGFFGVYDGHGGPSTSKFCGEHMYEFVSKAPAFLNGNIEKALYDGFMEIDNYLHGSGEAHRSGCTALVLYVREDDVYCANAGDSRCVFCTDTEVHPLSLDHKPFNPGEQIRIERAGGFVMNRRVNGALALSRAIGDFSFKRNASLPWDQQAVTGAPEVRTHRLNRDRDEFAVIACDGIWDVMTNEQVIEFVRLLIQKRKPLGEIAEMLIDFCLSPSPFGMGCDNMSVIIIQFKRRPQGHSCEGSNSKESQLPIEVSPSASAASEMGLPT